MHACTQVRRENERYGRAAPSIVCEFIDDLTRRILNKSDLLDKLPNCIPCHRLEIESGFFALSTSEDKMGSDLLKRLLLQETDDSPGAARMPITNYFSPEELQSQQLSYWDLCVRVRQRCHVLVGCSRGVQNELSPRAASAAREMRRKTGARLHQFGSSIFEMVFNPSAKETKYSWTPSDSLVVLGNFPKMGSPTKEDIRAAREKYKTENESGRIPGKRRFSTDANFYPGFYVVDEVDSEDDGDDLVETPLPSGDVEPLMPGVAEHIDSRSSSRASSYFGMGTFM